MAVVRRFLLLFCVASLTACGNRAPDFVKDVPSPSGNLTAQVSGYQPEGTLEGYLTVAFSSKAGAPDAAMTMGHMLNVNAGWLDEHRFAIVYDVLEPAHLQSPVYPSGGSSSAIEIVLCNARQLNCDALRQQLIPAHSILIKQFPEGDWSDES